MSLFGIALPGDLDSSPHHPALDPNAAAGDSMQTDETIRGLQDLLDAQNEPESTGDVAKKSSSDSAPNKKRPRQETVTLACVGCRSQHLKCDGRAPLCSRCAKKGIECVWDSKRRKRGPQKKKPPKNDGDAIVGEDGYIYLPVANIPDFSHRRLAPLSSSASGSSSSIAQNRDLTNRFVLLDFLNVYMEHLFPIIAVNPPLTDPSEIVQLPWNTSLDDASKMFMFSILSFGARGVGNWEYAVELQNRSRSMLGELFDRPAAHVASTQFILANLFADSGDPHKALLYLRAARTTLESLMVQHHGVEVLDGVLLPYLYLATVINEVDYVTHIDEFDFFDYVRDQLEHLGPRNDTYRLLQCFLDMFTTWMESLLGVHSVKQVDDLVYQMTRHLENIPTSMRLRPSIKYRLERMLKAIASVLYFHVHETDRALKLADEVVEYVKLLGMAYHDVWSICDLFQIAQVHLRIDETKFNEDVELLLAMAPVHPLAERACRRLHRLRQQWELAKQSPGALVLTPFAVSSTIEITNESDELLMPWSAQNFLTNSSHSAAKGYGLPLYKKPFLQLSSIYSNNQIKDAERFQEIPDSVSTSPFSAGPPDATQVPQLTSNVGLMDFMATHGHAVEIESSQSLPPTFSSESDFLATLEQSVFMPNI